MSKRFATLEDVAEAAGMSRAQVSRALRGDGGVKPATRLPCVFLGKHLAQTNVAMVDIDDDGGTTQAIHHLITLGHRRIAHIGGTDEVSAKERIPAYRAAMEGAGLEPTVFSAGQDVNSGRRGIEYFMSQPTPSTGLFASNDAIAIGAIDRLRGMGLRVLEDLSVVGFDDIRPLQVKPIPYPQYASIPISRPAQRCERCTT